jgi:hypothetical protein
MHARTRARAHNKPRTRPRIPHARRYCLLWDAVSCCETMLRVIKSASSGYIRHAATELPGIVSLALLVECARTPRTHTNIQQHSSTQFYPWLKRSQTLTDAHAHARTGQGGSPREPLLTAHVYLSIYLSIHPSIYLSLYVYMYINTAHVLSWVKHSPFYYCSSLLLLEFIATRVYCYSGLLLLDIIITRVHYARSRARARAEWLSSKFGVDVVTCKLDDPAHIKEKLAVLTAHTSTTHTSPRHITSWHITPWYITSWHITSWHTSLWHTTPWRETSWHTRLWCKRTRCSVNYPSMICPRQEVRARLR